MNDLKTIIENLKTSVIDVADDGKTLYINGSVYVLKEQAAQEPKKKTPYDRVRNGEYYYWIGSNGEVFGETEYNTCANNADYDSGNYFNDVEFCKQEAKKRILEAKIRRWQAQNDEVVEWDANYSNNKYYIYYNWQFGQLKIDCRAYMEQSTTHFTSKEKAEECLEVFRPELEEYFGIGG